MTAPNLTTPPPWPDHRAELTPIDMPDAAVDPADDWDDADWDLIPTGL